MKKILLALAAVSVLIIAGCQTTSPSGKAVSAPGGALLYKDPSCTCCGGYADMLQREGVDVSIKPTSQLAKIKREQGVPASMQSCHTMIIDGYVVEGHVPKEAVDKLLSERPEIDGIALPGMPSGSPGMPGPKRGDFVIHKLKDGADAGVFMTL